MSNEHSQKMEMQRTSVLSLLLVDVVELKRIISQRWAGMRNSNLPTPLVSTILSMKPPAAAALVREINC